MLITRYNIYFLIFIFFTLISSFCNGQTNQTKGWSALEYAIEISDKWEVDLSQHFRLKEDFKVVDAYITESEIFYKPTKKITLSGQLRYYKRNDNNGGIQGFEDMMRYRVGVEKEFNLNKINLELRLAYQNRFSLDRDGRFKKRIRIRPMIEWKIKDWSNNPKIYFEYFNELEGNKQEAFRYGISKKIKTSNSQDISLRYFFQKYKEIFTSNSTAHIISVKYSFEKNK